MKVTVFFTLLILSSTALALNRTMLGMPAHQGYMNFVLKKYYDWSRNHFQFPPDTPIIRELSGHLDHWLVEGSILRQFTMTHGVDDQGKVFKKLRLYVSPAIRAKIPLKDKALPSAETLRFYEVSDSGEECAIYSEDMKEFAVWCRTSSSATFGLKEKEVISDHIPENWPVPFPVMGKEVLIKIRKGEEQEISFFGVSPHPSRMPKDLLLPVYLNTKDPLFPLDRISTTKMGSMSVHYP